MKTTLRVVRFAPYRKGGPTFTLTLLETGRHDSLGKWYVGYRLSCKGAVIFEGEDFACSPLYAVDSDNAVRAIMGFLTLVPGDVEPEYFRDYTPQQWGFVENHAEALAVEVSGRFGEDS